MSAGDVSVNNADAEVLRLISGKVDSLLMLCETDAELRNYSLKFKLEHAVDKTAFEAKREDGEEMLHFQRVLQRMADLSLQIAPHILRRTRRYLKAKYSTGGNEASTEAVGSTLADPTVSVVELPRRSSVEEFCDGSEAWLETGAHLSHVAVELLCLILVSHPRLVKTLQMYLLQSDVFVYIEDALSISREHEIAFFQEGYRAEHIRLMANLTLDNVETSSFVVGNSSLLSAILSSTRYDEENPGMVEWAEFCIRNLCSCSGEAREKIRRLAPISISDESKELLSGRVDCHLNPEGKMVLRCLMPPRKNSVAMRHRAHMIASSVEEQEAALMEWRAKAREDKQKLHHIHTKINLHKKSAETTKRGGRWFVDCAALHQEAVSCELDLVKACASCAHVLPDSLRNEWAEQEVQYMELFNTLNGRVMGMRKELRGLDHHGKRLSNEGVQRLFKKLSVLREECLDKKKEIDVEVERLLDEETWDGNIQDTPIETLQKLFQSTMESFERLCEWREGKGNPALIETYREGLETEGNKAIAQITMSKTKKEGSMRSLNDLRTISLILKTYGGEMESSTTASFIPEDVYQRVQRAVPHISRTSARGVVDEVLRRKRERIYARSVILQYKKKSAELLELFKKAMIAEEEIIKMQNSIDEEARVREECQQKTQKELERLRAAREAKDATYRAEEEAKRRKEAEKEHHIHCIREAEFQERLRRLRMYKEQQREIQEKERIVQETIAEENALKKAMQQERNAKRVKERTEEYEEKCRLRKKYQQEMEELNEARKRTLEAFFKGVERRLGVTCDPKRVLQPTVSSQQSVPFVSFSQASKSAVHGYTVDDIMRDPRFRLQIALLEAGLHQTAYGREVISRGYHVPAAQRPSEDNPLRVDY